MKTGISRFRKFTQVALCVGIAILGLGGTLLYRAARAEVANEQKLSILAAAQRFANFSPEQHLAMHQAAQARNHPQWKTLSWSARATRLATFIKRALQSSTSVSGPPSASFQGNLTAINTPAGNAIALQRQADCSLSLLAGSYTVSFTSPTIDITSTTPNYEQTLHSQAGLTTQVDAFKNGCGSVTPGNASTRRGVYLGTTTQGQYLFAGAGYDNSVAANAVYYGTVDPNTLTVQAFTADLSDPNVQGVAAGDVNGDGMADIVGIDLGSASLHVWLVSPNGTVGTPTTITLAASGGVETAVLADVNGDGKLDIVAVWNNYSNEMLSVLLGDGTGNFTTAQTVTLSPPTGSKEVASIVAADLRGTGVPDIVLSDSLVLLNNGQGNFTVSSTLGFPVLGSTSSWGPNIVAADFNNDGKPDIATNDGESIGIYLGNGDGTFTAGAHYATINNVGYMNATDLDGDGNIDLYTGLADGIFFGGDQFEIYQVYALMGNGNGTFQGAPVLPFTYNGNNLADLNGDGIPDAVGVNSSNAFISYLGDGKGGFTAVSTTLPALPSSNVSSTGVNSYTLADMNGDGKADLVFIDQGYYAPDNSTGFFIAAGNGDGTFATPTYVTVPDLLPSGAAELNKVLSNIRVADFNGDGKPDVLYNYAEDDTAGNQYLGTAVQLANGDGTFQAPQTLPFYSGANSVQQTAQVVAVADLNKDGIPDLVFITESSTVNSSSGGYPYYVQVALGNGKGGFSTPATVATADTILTQSYYGSQAGPLAVADMNNDGIPDLVVVGADSSENTMEVAIALGNGDGTFKAPAITSYAGAAEIDVGLGIGDFNGDGKLDVVTTSIFNPSSAGVTFGNGDGTLQTYSGPYGLTPSQVINVTADGASAYIDLSGKGNMALISGSTLLIPMTATSTTTTPATPDYSVSASSSSGSVAPGQSAQVTVTVTPTNGFAGNVSLSCTGLPSGATCSFSPSAVTISSGAAAATLTINTTAQTAQATPAVPRPTRDPFSPDGMIVASAFLPLGLRRIKGKGLFRTGGSRWIAGLLLISMAALSACGGGGNSSSGNGGSGGGGAGSGGSTGTAAGTYAVSIVAASGSTSHAASYTLTVN